MLMKIIQYQASLPDGHAAELDELRRENILTEADLGFLASKSVTYKPHRLPSHHALDMFQMPTEGGGCVFIGPKAALSKHQIRLRELPRVLHRLLGLARPPEELLFLIEIGGDYDWMGVHPKMIFFNFKNDGWRERLPAIRETAAALGLAPDQDGAVQIDHSLSYPAPGDAARTVAAVMALLSRGCGLTEESEVVYSAGALEEVESPSSEERE
jgi:hypothetical protein